MELNISIQTNGALHFPRTPKVRHRPDFELQTGLRTKKSIFAQEVNSQTKIGPTKPGGGGE